MGKREEPLTDKKIALISMDVEEWYHLQYLHCPRPTQVSTLDGVETFANLLEASGNIPATFFVVGDVARSHCGLIRSLISKGHEVASHGPDHSLVADVPVPQFIATLARERSDLEDRLSIRVTGYRAPCFSMNSSQVASLHEAGFLYDSSYIQFRQHPLYGSLQLPFWHTLRPGVQVSDQSGLVEFEVPTWPIWGYRLPFTGGGYFRLYPSVVTELLVRRYLREAHVVVVYVHPFECSSVPNIPLPPDTGRVNRIRFSVGRRTLLRKMGSLIHVLREEGCEFMTFEAARKALNG